MKLKPKTGAPKVIGGVRIPAGSGACYSNTPDTKFQTRSGGLKVYNLNNCIDAQSVYHLPLPEGALVRQLAAVGDVTEGWIQIELGAVRADAPAQHSLCARLVISSSTPYEKTTAPRQKRVEVNLPTTGKKSVTTNRHLCYFIEARFSSDSATERLEEAPHLFYIEVYWA